MHRHAIAVVFVLANLSVNAQSNQNAQPAATPSSDPMAASLAQKSMTAMTGGIPIADVTVNANVISIVGSTSQTGTGIFYASGVTQGRVDLNLNKTGLRSEARSSTNGTPQGAWQAGGKTAQAYAGHNCWTDAAWFFPALSSLSQTLNPNSVFSYVGQEQHGSVSTQHIRVYQLGAPKIAGSSLSTMDFYLDAISSLPMAIVFNSHPDDNMGTNIPVEIDFANYQAVNGIRVPFRFQEIFNGLVTLDVTVTSVISNSGIPNSVFTLQ